MTDKKDKQATETPQKASQDRLQGYRAHSPFLEGEKSPSEPLSLEQTLELVTQPELVDSIKTWRSDNAPQVDEERRDKMVAHLKAERQRAIERQQPPDGPTEATKQALLEWGGLPMPWIVTHAPSRSMALIFGNDEHRARRAARNQLDAYMGRGQCREADLSVRRPGPSEPITLKVNEGEVTLEARQWASLRLQFTRSAIALPGFASGKHDPGKR